MSRVARLRWAGVGLKSYLSSGKSSAMAISFRPISFQAASTACDGLSAGFTAACFLASWAWAGKVRIVVAKNAAVSTNVVRMVPPVWSESATAILVLLFIRVNGGAGDG